MLSNKFLTKLSTQVYWRQISAEFVNLPNRFNSFNIAAVCTLSNIHPAFLQNDQNCIEEDFISQQKGFQLVLNPYTIQYNNSPDP